MLRYAAFEEAFVQIAVRFSCPYGHHFFITNKTIKLESSSLPSNFLASYLPRFFFLDIEVTATCLGIQSDTIAGTDQEAMFFQCYITQCQLMRQFMG